MKPLKIGPYKIIDRLSDVTYELLTQEGFTFHTHRNHLVPYNPKEPLIFPLIKEHQTLAELISDDEIISETDNFTSFDSFEEIFDHNLEKNSKTENQSTYNSPESDIRQYYNTCQPSLNQDNLTFSLHCDKFENNSQSVRIDNFKDNCTDKFTDSNQSNKTLYSKNSMNLPQSNFSPNENQLLDLSNQIDLSNYS